MTAHADRNAGRDARKRRQVAAESRPQAPSSAPSRGVVLPALVAAACVLVSVTFQLNDPDVWQHLVVGKAIWNLHSIPSVHLWSWPTLGQGEVLPSWGFRALLWPFYAAGGTAGLFVWRWLTSLATFAIAWVVARRLGARGALPLLVIVVCALTYRFRSQVRPETLAGLFLATELLVLEGRRSGGRDLSRWLPVLACAWANAHISFYLALLVLAIYALAETVAPSKGRPRHASLWWTLGIAAVACLANPFGHRALMQPFEYFFVWRHEPIFRTIGELQPIDWSFNRTNGLLIVMTAWPVLQILRARARAVDLVEILLCLFFTATALLNQRFTATWAIVAAPFVGRDLEWAAHAMWPMRLRVPAGIRPLLLAVACVGVSIPDWRRPNMQPGVGVDPLSIPAGACDFMSRHDLRGRIFNHFELSGYLLWRFWPERGRLPFMDIHQSGRPRERLVYVAAATDSAAWRKTYQAYAIDLCVVRRLHARGDKLLDFLDADSTWAMVFVDDVASVYVRRTGNHAGLVQSHAFRVVPGGSEGLRALEAGVAADASLRRRFRAELERVTRESAACSGAHSILASLDLAERRPESAIAHLDSSRRIDPLSPLYHYRRAVAERILARYAPSLADFLAAVRAGEVEHVDAEIAPILETQGKRGAAHRAYQNALRLRSGDPTLEAGLERTRP